MNLDQLKEAAALRAAEIAKPVPFTVAGIGTLHVRKRTMLEIESDSEEQGDRNTRLRRDVARLLCDETGRRLANTPKELDDVMAIFGALTFTEVQAVADAVASANGQKAEELGND